MGAVRVGGASLSPVCSQYTSNEIHALRTISPSSFSLNPQMYTHAISPDASYLALTGPSLDVHPQGIGHWEAPMIVEGHKVEGGCQVVVHKHRD